MIRIIFLKELQEYLSNKTILISSLVIIALFTVNIWVFKTNYSKRQELLNTKDTEISNNFQKSSKSFKNVVFQNNDILIPPSETSFISTAEEAVLPNSMQVDYFKSTGPQYKKEINIFQTGFYSFDATNIVLYILSFICLCFSYNVFCGERSNGTLKLMLSNSVPRFKIVIGKYLALITVLMIPIIVGILINMGFISFMPFIKLSGDIVLASLFFMLTVLLFISLNTLVGFAISALTKTPVVSLSFSLIFWILFAVVLPNVSWLVSKRYVHVRTEEQFQRHRLQKRLAMWDDNIHGLSSSSSWIGKKPVPKLVKRIRFFTDRNELVKKLEHERNGSRIEQTDLAINISKISPYAIFRFVGERISNNGYFGFKEFYKQIRDYQTLYSSALKNIDAEDSDSFHQIWQEQWYSSHFMSNKPVDIKNIPRFTYKPVKLSESMAKCGFDLMILALWNILLFAIIVFTFNRYDVR